MKKNRIFLMAAAALLLFSSCMSTKMVSPQSIPQVQLELKDLEVTEPVVATAVCVKVFGVDWERLFSSSEADYKGSVYTNMLLSDKTEQYAIYDLLRKNAGYDMVLYPQVHKVVRKPFLGLGSIYQVTEVKITARMGKIKQK